MILESSRSRGVLPPATLGRPNRKARSRLWSGVRRASSGRVLASKHPEFHEGDLVTGSLGVQRYAISDGTGLEKCDAAAAPLSAWLGGMGVSGLTAYFALIEVCKPQPGQTVVVNGAAGAVGSIAGQIARLAGARTIGGCFRHRRGFGPSSMRVTKRPA